MDNLNPYYDPRLKEERLAELDRRDSGALRFVKADSRITKRWRRR